VRPEELFEAVVAELGDDPGISEAKGFVSS
jgi:hypothetical protein